MKHKYPLSPSDISEEDEESRFSKRSYRDDSETSSRDGDKSDSSVDDFPTSDLYDFTAPMLFKEEPGSDEDAEEPSAGKKKKKGRSGKVSKCLMIVGYLAAIMAAFSSAASASSAQALGGYVPEFELNFCRFAVGLILSLPAIVGLKLQLVPDMWSGLWLGIFCLVANVYNVTFYGAAIYLPVATLGGMESCLLIFLTTAITLITTRECKIATIVCVILCSVGTVLLIQPAFIFRNIIPQTEITTHPMCSDRNRPIHRFVFGGVDADDFVTPVNLSLSNFQGSNSTSVWNNAASAPEVEISNNFKGYVLITIAALAHTGQVLILKHPLRDINVFVVLFWQGLVGTFISLTIMLAMEAPMFPQYTSCLLLVMGQSLGIALATLMAIASMLYIPPLMYAVLSTLQLVFFLGAQYTVLKNINSGHHNAVEVTGAVTVFLGNIVGPAYRLYTDMTSVDKGKTKKGKKKRKTEDSDEYDSDDALFQTKSKR